MDLTYKPKYFGTRTDYDVLDEEMASGMDSILSALPNRAFLRGTHFQLPFFSYSGRGGSRGRIIGLLNRKILSWFNSAEKHIPFNSSYAWETENSWKILDTAIRMWSLQLISICNLLK